ncbi:hypothetical protein DBR32_12855 [Taibaiella sp. KBW10]|nr:hypothetical protein DBR32_12855 [Taibaiella sp. KBW10]
MQNTCINKARGICINRNNADYNLYLQKNQWNDTTARVKIYHANGSVVFNQLYSAIPTITYNGVLSYAIAANYYPYSGENVVVEVSSAKNAPVHMLLTPVQQLCYAGDPCTTPITPAFTPLAPVCKGSTFTLPTASNEGSTGTWTPSVNNQVTTTYTFTPDTGQCANSTTMTVAVKGGLSWTSGDTDQVLAAYTFLSPIVYTLANGATGTAFTGLPAGVTATVSGSTITISGVPSVTGTFPYTLRTTTSCGADSTRGSITINAPIADWTLAPNSYIFTGKDKNGNKTDGLYIPVKKAYAMWADTTNPELSLRSPIPAGSLISAYVYWEDVSGLITSEANYKLEIVGTGENAKVKVLVNKEHKEGNALVTFHAGTNNNNTDPIYWSWHVWVTDDVDANGSTYRQGFETDKNNIPLDQVTNRDGSPYTFQWMNRNLGATNAAFLGNDWNKSAGLMYQWGRKDPLPPMYYKDGTGYEINGAAGTFRGAEFTQNTNLPFGWMMRPYDNPGSHTEVAQNIRYSIKNPLKAITFLSRFGHWFSDQPYKVANTDIYRIVNWDLWSDNRKGKWSKVYTTDTAVAADTKSYELKSPYDPCPCGWRIPSHYGSIAAGGQENLSSPWGRNGSWENDDPTDNSKFHVNTVNPILNNVKVYPSLGYDFSAQNDRNIGVFPLSGAYVFTGPNEVADYVTSTPKLAYINWLSTAGTATATLSVYDSASGRNMGFVSDYYKYPTQAKYRFNVAQIAPSKGAGTVRCMRDPNEKYLGNFETEFIASVNSSDKTDNADTLKHWIKDANSYIVMTNTVTEKRINLRKAYAMYKLFLSEQHQLPQGQPSISVYWSTNNSLINNVSLNNTAIGSSEMVVSLTQGQTGNAVIALHVGSNGTSADPVIWSWHIWAPETVPVALAPYKTEDPYQSSPSSGQIIDATNNCLTPPLVTEFMDRNMGALIAMPSNTAMEPAMGKKAMGLHYQWGRKDPIPTFLDQLSIIRNGGTINAGQYNTNFTQLFSVYGAGAIAGNDKRYVKIGRILKYSVENPLTYLYNDGATQDWISNEPGLEAGRWGHAMEKSPYDPCPDGWRVPDVSFSFLNQAYNTQVSNGVKGTSPWYLGKIADPVRTDGIMGVDQRWDGTNTVITGAASQSYKGRLSTYTNSSGWAGYLFDDPIYSIGNYPVTGIRGEAGVGVSNNFPRIGAWTAAMGDLMGVNAIALMIRYGKMQTGIGVAPHQAMACRCAKINYGSNGNEIGRYDPNAIPVPTGATLMPENRFSPHEVSNMVQAHKLIVFPNPVNDILSINASDDKDYYYQVYNMAGQLVLQGKFVNKQTNVSSLAAGAYLIRINNAESVVKIVKK